MTERFGPPPRKEVIGPMTVSELAVYYLKSAKGKSLMEAEVGHRGLLNDRIFTTIDAETDDGTFRSQRADKALSLVTPQLFENTLILDALGMDQLVVSIIRKGQTCSCTYS